MRLNLLGLIAVISLLFVALSVRADEISIYRNKVLTKSIDEILTEHPLPTNQNLQSTLIEKSQGSSLHLVQIRTREKPHTHRIHDLFIILKKGEGILHIGQGSRPMKTGDMVLIPRGVPHHFETTSKEVAVGVGIFTPSFDGKDVVPFPKDE